MAYPAAQGSAASYYPETNVLVPLDNVADISNPPASKGIVVRLVPVDDQDSTTPAESVLSPVISSPTWAATESARPCRS